MKNGLVTKLRLKPPSELRRSVRESSLLGGRCAAAKTASKATLAKTCFISPEQGFRRCLARPMRLEEGMDLAHRQGNPLFGFFPGEHAHFGFRRDHRALHGDGVRMARGIVG